LEDINDKTGIGSGIFFDDSDNVVFWIPLRKGQGKFSWTDPVILPNYNQIRSRLPRNLAKVLDPQVSQLTITYEDYNATDNIHSLEQMEFDPEASADETSPDDIVTDTDSPESNAVHQLRIQAQSHLWHQRLGHVNHRIVSEMHKHVDGIPKVPLPSIIDHCPVCLSAKMRKSNAATANSCIATSCFQGLSIDLGFVVQKSKNSDRYIDNLGFNGESCYILISNHFSGMVFGKALETKAPPIQWLHQWLAWYNPDLPDKTVRFDQGGELGRSKQVLEIFRNYGYNIEITGADASHQNGCVECSHQTIGNMMRTLLNGADLPRKFWPYAFQHSLFIMNQIIHDGKDGSPITICTKKKFSLQQLRTFACFG
jgi:GAG-pre-integrase domain